LRLDVTRAAASFVCQRHVFACRALSSISPEFDAAIIRMPLLKFAELAFRPCTAADEELPPRRDAAIFFAAADASARRLPPLPISSWLMTCTCRQADATAAASRHAATPRRFIAAAEFPPPPASAHAIVARASSSSRRAL